jgi:hypothetical protein
VLAVAADAFTLLYCAASPAANALCRNTETTFSPCRIAELWGATGDHVYMDHQEAIGVGRDAVRTSND